MAAEHRGPGRSGAPAPHERFLVDTGYHWGEWLEPAGEGDGELPLEELIGSLTAEPRAWVATAYFEHSSRILAEVAALLGRGGDAARFREYADGARAAWQAEYLTDSDRLEPDAQATYVRALQFGLVDDDRRAATAGRLVERIRARDTHLATGFLSTGLLLDQLSENGHGDVALDLLLQDTPPSWLGQVALGATTIWETWTGHDDAGRAALSHNHYSLGASVRWLYEHLAGIRRAEPGWRRIVIDPLLTDRIPEVAATTGTPFGDVSSSWSLEGTDARLQSSIPTGASAEVRLPGGSEAVQLDGVPLHDAGRPVTADGHATRVTIGSGEYDFAFSVSGG